jgi:asparagine synthase (glutamine-hydrolysing)
MLGMLDEDGWQASYTDAMREAARDSDDHFLDGWQLAPEKPLTAAAMSDTLGYIPDCLNVKVDICSMACGLEVRSPFLDHKLVEACARIPECFKIRGRVQKYILKKAFAGELPREILHRGKAGFGIPLADWFRGGLGEMARDMLLAADSRIQGIFNPDKIRTMLEEHATRRRNWHIQLWRLMILESWLQGLASASASHLPASALCAN